MKIYLFNIYTSLAALFWLPYVFGSILSVSEISQCENDLVCSIDCKSYMHLHHLKTIDLYMHRISWSVATN